MFRITSPLLTYFVSMNATSTTSPGLARPPRTDPGSELNAPGKAEGLLLFWLLEPCEFFYERKGIVYCIKFALQARQFLQVRTHFCRLGKELTQ